ncbi:hypothetical protein DKX38_016753 [Salix brachista]|uniref:Uncharacterized protein n=1 Tax=Salix brachista TaxID=2182728 RepID=A0A5N5KTI0_9ROSI|nr:hypothetical protein DKX38_016753 [Salix brachista]
MERIESRVMRLVRREDRQAYEVARAALYKCCQGKKRVLHSFCNRVNRKLACLLLMGLLASYQVPLPLADYDTWTCSSSCGCRCLSSSSGNL